MYKTSVKIFLVLIVITLTSSSILANVTNKKQNVDEQKNVNYSIKYIGNQEGYVTIKVVSNTKTTQIRMPIDKDGKSYQILPNRKKVSFTWAINSEKQISPVSLEFEDGTIIPCNGTTGSTRDACDSAIISCAAAIATCLLAGGIPCIVQTAVCLAHVAVCVAEGGTPPETPPESRLEKYDWKSPDKQKEIIKSSGSDSIATNSRAIPSKKQSTKLNQ